jgi:membrane protease YdiL (CAAX protease family)
MMLTMGCFYTAIIFGVWAQKLMGSHPEGTSVRQMIIATLSIQGAGLVFMTLFVREHGLNWAEAFGLSNHCGRAVLFGVLTACIFLPFARLLQEVSFELMTRLPHLPINPEQEVVQTLRQASVWAQRVAMGAATILLAPLAEEMFFRGILYPAIKQAGFPRLALWGTSVVFAAIHLTPVIFLPLLVLALLLVWLYEKTDNLLAPIAAHSLFNGLNFAMVYVMDKRLG